jgi:hypothetical protein
MKRDRRRENIFLHPTDYETFIKVIQEKAAGWKRQAMLQIRDKIS